MGPTRTAAFIGNMNAMPMTYALQLRERGWSVTYFVDTPHADKLSRPELKFPSIQYPYPGWIIERRVRSQVLAVLAAGVVLRDVIAVLRRADVVFLSGLYLCLAKFLKPTQRIVFLSHGSDLDSWCDRDSIEGLTKFFASRLGGPLARLLVTAIVNRMIESLRRASAVVTFPPGLSVPGDRVIARELKDLFVSRIPRYDISFADLPAAERQQEIGDAGTLRVICGTRHTFNEHPGLTERENKGTDILIRALAQYSRLRRKSLEVHFFEKGLDLEEAKELCASEGIAPYVAWHPEMPFHDFLLLHQRCHIAFDQLGCHWVGAGMYAMYLSMPLIANSRKDVLEGFWGEPSPICHAESEADALRWLIALEDPQLRRDIGERSRRFALRHFDGANTTQALLRFLRESERDHALAQELHLPCGNRKTG